MKVIRITVFVMTNKNLTLYLKNTERTFEFNLTNSEVFPTETYKDKYTSFEYQYLFNYTSFLPFDYESDNNYNVGAEKTFFTSGYDRVIFYINKKFVTLEKNTFMIKTKDFRFRHIIPHSTAVNNTHLRQGDYNAFVKTYGGESHIVQPKSTEFPSDVYFDIISAYDLNEKNHFNELKLITDFIYTKLETIDLRKAEAEEYDDEEEKNENENENEEEEENRNEEKVQKVQKFKKKSKNFNKEKNEKKILKKMNINNQEEEEEYLKRCEEDRKLDNEENLRMANEFKKKRNFRIL